jgi:hypothetical protein
MKKITSEKQPFERLEISKEDLLRLFGVRIRKIKIFWLLFSILIITNSKLEF